MVNWVMAENSLLRIDGKGLIDAHLYQQKDRLIMHLVNLTSAATWRQPLEEFIAVGPFDVKLKLPKSIRGKNVVLKVSEQKISAGLSDGWIFFNIKSLLNHELVVIG